VDISDDTETTAEDTAIVTDVLANDTFAGFPVVTGVTQGAKGTVSINADNTVTYTPNADFNGSDSYSYTVTSGTVTETATVALLVTPVADTADDIVVTDEDAPVISDVLGNDGFAGSPVITIVTQGNHGTVGLTADNRVSYTPNADFNGTDFYSYEVVSGGVVETATVNVAINPLADIVADRIVTSESSPITTAVLANDRFESTPVVTSVSQGANGAVTLNADNTITYMPDAGFKDTDSYTYTVSAGGVEETATVTVSVAPVPKASSPDDTSVIDDEVLPGDNSGGIDPLGREDIKLPVEEDTLSDLWGLNDSLSGVLDDYASGEDDDIIYLDENNEVVNPLKKRNNSGYIYFDADFYKQAHALKFSGADYRILDSDELTTSGPFEFGNEELRQFTGDDGFNLALTEMDQAFDLEAEDKTIRTNLVTVSMTTLTVGLVSYLLRAGSLVASLMSSFPLWRRIDPIVVFARKKKKRAGKDDSDKDNSTTDQLFDGRDE
jgi:hypothetical protein